MVIGEVFLGAFLQVILEKLTSAGIKVFLEQRKGRELSQVIEVWEKKLRIIEAVLSDAEQKQYQSNAVKVWLHNLQDLAYDLEDLLDVFSTDARLHGSDEHDSVSAGCSLFQKVPRFLTCASGSSPSENSNRYSTSIEHINNRLQDVLTEASSFGLAQHLQSRDQPHEHPQDTSSLPCEPVVYGRDHQKREIIQRLLSDEPSNAIYNVIPVVGQGGIGKTTLAQSIYNDEQVKNHFEIRAWACVSDVFDVLQITTKLINSAAHSLELSCNFSTLEEAHLKLKNVLACKKSLIVLDDVWSEDYNSWHQLQIPFQEAAKGSRVIITTRIEMVAMNIIATESPVVILKCLSDDDCWSIFKQHAAVKDNPVEIQKEIVQLCKGLPLAAKALGGFLRKENRGKWPSIIKKNKWREESGILPVLRLSYHHLPQTLKRAFAYCSIFPKDHVFLHKHVILMWMAEGFVSEDENESMEDKGRNYFQDLVSRSFFEQKDPFDEELFIMHDLIHDLAQWAAGDICKSMYTLQKVSLRIRYLSFNKEVLEARTWTLGEVGHRLRMFAFFGNTSIGDPSPQTLDFALNKLQFVRSLSVQRAGIRKLPDCIGNMKHLRFLNLSYNSKLKKLPESISNLCNLQSLLLNGCQSLGKLICNIAPLTELRHLETRGSELVEMPLEMGKLTRLQSLNSFYLSVNSGSSISELRNSKHLGGSLALFRLQNVVSEEAKEARLHEKIGLDELIMRWDTSSSAYEVHQKIEEEVLEQLQPPKQIKKLWFQCGYKALKFPVWLGNPYFTYLDTIVLNCLKCEYSPPLGQLQFLCKLFLNEVDHIKTVGPEFYGIGCSNPFPALKKLSFSRLLDWQWLHPPIDSNTTFPCLEELSINLCPLLQGHIPSHLPSLKNLYIEICPLMRFLLPPCMFRELVITGCEELYSTSSIICCSDKAGFRNISRLNGIEGIQVQGLDFLDVVYDISNADNYDMFMGAKYKKRIQWVNCPKLQIPDGFGELQKLTNLAIGNCEELMVFLENNFPPSVRCLTIYGDTSLKHLSRIINPSTYLEELRIAEGSSLITVGNLPITLKRLLLCNMRIEQPANEWGLHLLTSLECLEIEEVEILMGSVESISDQDLHLPSSLRKLDLNQVTNLKSIKSLSNFSNLTELCITECPNLESLGIDFPLSNLKRTRNFIRNCPKLEFLTGESSKHSPGSSCIIYGQREVANSCEVFNLRR